MRKHTVHRFTSYSINVFPQVNRLCTNEQPAAFSKMKIQLDSKLFPPCCKLGVLAKRTNFQPNETRTM